MQDQKDKNNTQLNKYNTTLQITCYLLELLQLLNLFNINIMTNYVYDRPGINLR